MAIAYFDSSAFVKLLVEEPGSEAAARLWDSVDVVVSSRLAHPEVAAALSAARRARRLTLAAERQARGDWEELWSATRVVEVTPAVATDAADLSASLVLGGADAVHLASARVLGEGDPIVVTWDLRLRAAAGRSGLVVAPA